MYIPPHFVETDPAQLTALVAAYPLATITAATAQGLVANHIPLLPAPDGSFIGHVALANDMHRLIAPDTPVLAIFQGVSAYVSPNFYPSKAQHHRHVPTWNYQVAHLHGHLTFQHDDHAKRAAVALLTRQHEHRLNGDQAWKMADAPADYLAQMLQNIVAFRFVPLRVLVKSKLSQNRDDPDHAGTVAGLGRSGHAEMAANMAARRPRGA